MCIRDRFVHPSVVHSLSPCTVAASLQRMSVLYMGCLRCCLRVSLLWLGHGQLWGGYIMRLSRLSIRHLSAVHSLSPCTVAASLQRMADLYMGCLRCCLRVSLLWLGHGLLGSGCWRSAATDVSVYVSIRPSCTLYRLVQLQRVYRGWLICIWDVCDAVCVYLCSGWDMGC